MLEKKLGKKEVFKKCSMCAVVWQERLQFLQDKSLQINGYQANFTKLELGIFYFTHLVDGCCTTMAVEAWKFFDLNPGKRYKKRMTGIEDCPGYCLEKDQLDRCHVKCECAFVRDVIHIIKNYKKGEKRIKLEEYDDKK